LKAQVLPIQRSPGLIVTLTIVGVLQPVPPPTQPVPADTEDVIDEIKATTANHPTISKDCLKFIFLRFIFVFVIKYKSVFLMKYIPL
jgi:hypothetical protein